MITVRRPQPDEAAAMAALHVACWRESYEAFLPRALFESLAAEKRHAIWARQIADPERILWTAYEETEPLAFINAGAAAEKDRGDADGEIAALYVRKAFHRTGLGRMLMARAADDWVARGGHALRVGVISANTSARAFYEGLGGQFLRNDHYDWDGNDLEIAIYRFDPARDLALHKRDL